MDYNNTNINLLEDDSISNLTRSEFYLREYYDIKEEVSLHKEPTINKLFGVTRDKCLSVIITKQIVGDLNDEELKERISSMVKLVEENVILVENFWMQEEVDDDLKERKSNYILYYKALVCSFQNLQRRHMKMTTVFTPLVPFFMQIKGLAKRKE